MGFEFHFLMFVLQCSGLHSLEVAVFLVLILEGSKGTVVIALVSLASSPVHCNGVSIAALDTWSQVLQFKGHLTKLASLMPMIPCPLLDRWIPPLPNRL